MRDAVSIVYRCKCCSKTHLAPTQVFQEAAFQSLQMQSYFDNTRYLCPASGGVKTYEFEDHFWINELMLPKLCSMVMRWLEQTGQVDQLFNSSEAEILSAEESMQHLPAAQPALATGVLISPGSKSHIIPKMDPGVLRKAAAG